MAFLLQMSPIEDVVPTLEDDPPQNGDIVELRCKQDRTRDLFGIQLEVMNKFSHFQKQTEADCYLVLSQFTSSNGEFKGP